VMIEDLIEKVFYEKLKEFFNEYVLRNNDLVRIRKRF